MKLFLKKFGFSLGAGLHLQYICRCQQRLTIEKLTFWNNEVVKGTTGKREKKLKY